MLTLTKASLALVEELFRYKQKGFNLPDFPGYSNNQWGIKAHNRPWIEDFGDFTAGQKIIEVGGGYSLFPKYLSDKYGLEAWIGDDFGMSSEEKLWSRWGDPLELPARNPSVKYVFEKFGSFSPQFPDANFDRIFTISTLEHISPAKRLDVFMDMHRCLKPGGRQLHTIDISHVSLKSVLKTALMDELMKAIPTLLKLESINKHTSEINKWINCIKTSGVNVGISNPSSIQLLDRRILIESPDVVYRFYPPNNSPKSYQPAASLLIVIERQ